MKNINRTYGDNIIIGTTQDGTKMYYNWHLDKMVENKTQATGYNTRLDAQKVIIDLQNEFPGYTWTTELDK